MKHKFILLLTSLSFPVFFFLKKGSKKRKKLLLLLISIWLMSAIWFFTAPDPRFAFGFLLFLAFFPLSVLLRNYPLPIYLYRAVFIISIPIILTYAFIKAEPILLNPNYLIYVEANDSPPYNKMLINNNIYNFSVNINNNWNNRCFYTPLPCICEKNPYLIRRGKSIKDGFKMNPITDRNFINNYNY